MNKKEYAEVINEPQFKKDYPIQLEDFGKDFIGCLSMLQDYKRSYENNIGLLQSANTIREIILNCTQGTFDICKLKHPYPKWQIVPEKKSQS